MDPVAGLLGAVANALKPFLLMPAFWLIALMVLGLAICRLPGVKGWIGERLVNLQCRLFLPRSDYAMVPNVTIPDGLGGTTQIDHVVVSRYGLFVVETKNMKGWIFGGEHDAQWTQKIHGGHSQKFQNPLRQNFKHTVSLAQILDLPRDKVFSCIAFVGEATLKTRDKLPPSVRTNAGWVSFVKEHRTQVLTQDEVEAILERIQEARLAPGFRTHREHVRYVKGLKTKEPATPAPEPTAPPSAPSLDAGTVAAPAAAPIAPPTSTASLCEGAACPRCGGRLVARTARQGQNAGQRFLGCSNYPTCRFVG